MYGHCGRAGCSQGGTLGGLAKRDQSGDEITYKGVYRISLDSRQAPPVL